MVSCYQCHNPDSRLPHNCCASDPWLLCRLCYCDKCFVAEPLNGELILPYLLFEEAFSYVALGHIFVDTEATKERKSGRVTVLVRA